VGLDVKQGIVTNKERSDPFLAPLGEGRLYFVGATGRQQG
jgi:hypothetical protein